MTYAMVSRCLGIPKYWEAAGWLGERWEERADLNVRHRAGSRSKKQASKQVKARRSKKPRRTGNGGPGSPEPAGRKPASLFFEFNGYFSRICVGLG